MVVDPGALMHIGASQSGTIFMVPTGTQNQQLNSAINTAVVGAFTPNALNYVGIDYTRFIDPTTDAQVYIWDPTNKSETTLVAPRAQILEFEIVISTSVWPANVLPIAIVTTDAGNNVVSITDSRWLLFRLGTGGTNPNPFFIYPWIDGRAENPVSSSSDSIDPFFGGDKQLLTLKDWMNSIMSALLEIKGTTYWYSLGSGGSIANLREDLGMTVVTGAGSIANGVLPNTIPVLTTTGNTASSNQLSSLASTVGITAGQVIMGNGIPTGTTVLSILGSTVTMSASATETLTGQSVAFYSPTSVTAPGQVNWDQGIFLDVIGSNLSYEFLPNPSSSDIQLANDQVAYVNLVRGQTIIPNLIFTNGSAVVQSVGSISWTGPLQAGDFVRLISDTDTLYYKILSVDSLSQVTLTIPYAGITTSASGVQAVYAFGSYAHSPTAQISDRYIHIANRNAVPTNGNTWWFLLREDNGSSVATVYVRFIGQELKNGDTNLVGDGFPEEVLQYIGSPAEYVSAPNYTNALIPGSVPQETNLTFGPNPAATTTIVSGQYFYIDSSGDNRKYYVWFKVNGVGTDPAPAADRTAIEVDILSTSTNAQVATAVVNSLNATPFDDFDAVTDISPNQNRVTVTNSSAGTSALPTAQTTSGLVVTNVQTGTGVGNAIIHDGDNLTLAIKELDKEFALILANANNPDYDEPLFIIPGIPANSNQLTGPISSGTDITLPLNSRQAETAQVYIVGKGALQLFLNGQYLNLSTASSPITAPMFSYHMSDGSFPSTINLTGSLKGGLAVEYTPASNVNLADIKFIMTVGAVGTKTGTLVAKVRTNSAGIPSGTILGTSNTFPVTSLVNPTATTVTFTFGTTVALTAGTPYWFTLETDSTYQAADGAGGAVVEVEDTNVTTPVVTPVTIISNTGVTNGTGYTIGDNTHGIIAGPWFVAGQTAKITSLQASLSYTSGTGNVIGDLYSVVQDNIANDPVLTFIESSTAINSTTLPATALNPALTTFTFSGVNTLTSGTTYAVIFRSSNQATSNFQFNNRITSTPAGSEGLMYKNFGTDNLFHASVASTNPNVYSGDVDVIATGNQTTNVGEYPIATYSGSVWTAQTTPTPPVELDIATTGSNGDWTEVGGPNTFSNQIQINRNLVIGDELTFRIESGGGASQGAAGPPGPSGPAGPSGAGPGGPAPIGTYSGIVTVLTSNCIMKADCSAGTTTFTLPSASSMAGRIFYFTKIDATGNAMTVAAAGADTINGLASQTTNTQYDSFMLVSDGTTWSML
jgi:hypothetical protein